MTAAATDAAALTVVSLFRIDPAERLLLLGVLDEFHRRALAPAPGFAGVRVHVSEDGGAVLMTTQWTGRRAHEAFATSARTVEASAPLRSFRGEEWIMDVALELDSLR